MGMKSPVSRQVGHENSSADVHCGGAFVDNDGVTREEGVDLQRVAWRDAECLRRCGLKKVKTHRGLCQLAFGEGGS